MDVTYALVEQAPGENGEPVDIRVQGGMVFFLVHRALATEPDHMFRLLSIYASEHVARQWVHVGDVVDVH